MKTNIIISVCTLCCLVFLFTGCKKFEDDTIDFSNKYSAYVDFSTSDTTKVKEGTPVSLVVRMNPIQYKDITVGYTVSGSYSTSGQLVIKAGTSNVTLNLLIPNNGIADGSRNALITLTSVSDGLMLGRIGRNIKIPLKIND